MSSSSAIDLDVPLILFDANSTSLLKNACQSNDAAFHSIQKINTVMKKS